MHRIENIAAFCWGNAYSLSSFHSQLMKISVIEKMQEKERLTNQKSISMHGGHQNSNCIFSMCWCTKGLKVFELSLSSVTHNHICMLRVCISVYRSLIVLVCFPTLSLSLELLLLSFTWNRMQVALWFVTFTQVFTTYDVQTCACVSVIFTVSVHVFYYQSNFVTESLKTWTVRTEWAHTHAHICTLAGTYTHTQTQKTRTDR